MDKLKILAYPSPGGSRQYRLDQIAKYINRSGEALMMVSDRGIDEVDIADADIIILEGTVSPKAIALCWAYSQEAGKVLITDIDDYMDVAEEHPLYKEHQELEASKWTRALISKADAVTTTTEFLAEQIKELNDNVKVLPNCLDMELWGTPKLINTDDEIRVVWAGSSTHREDILMLKPAIMQLLAKYPQMRFFYCGDGNLWLEDIFEKHPQTEYVEPTDLRTWPMKFKTLRADLALIPLVDNLFNKCKSNLKWLENAAYSVPCILSPTVYGKYVTEGKDGLIANSTEEFVSKAVTLIENKTLRDEIGSNARQRLLDTYDISKTWRTWLEFYQEQYQKKLHPVFEAEVGDTPREMIKKWTK